MTTSKLRTVLRLNALNCSVAGGLMAVAGNFVDRLLDTDHPGWVSIVGAALLPFAALCGWLATQPESLLERLTPMVVAGDVGWVLGSIVTIALGWYSATGITAVVAMAVVVGTFAVLQFRGWRQLPTTH